MIKISGVVIAKNEENTIADCLDSLSFCDEVIVIDSGSDDRTLEIAKKMGAKVFTLKTSDFSELRNVGFHKANGSWILYVDADERVTTSLRDNIKFQISNFKYDAYRVHRKNFYLGNNEWPYIERIERLFKKDKLEKWIGQLHESPVTRGTIGELDGYLLHYTHRGLTSMLEKTIKWSRIEAELRYNKGHPKMTWWRFPKVMLFSFFDYYLRQGGWRIGTAGLIESMYQSFSIFITYARLWELQQKKK